MIRGPKFRGISYKCGTSYFVEKQWRKAITEFETIPMFLEDELVCEMLGTCYANLENKTKAIEMYVKARDMYEKTDNVDKKERLNDKIEALTSGSGK